MKLKDANIALMMIVKNESKTLPRLIESVRPIISSWRIVDTGSTDGTQEIIQQLLGDLPGELVERPWVNFGHNRSELVAKFPKGCDYALLLDADQVVQIAEDYDEIQIPKAEILMIPVIEPPVQYRMAYFIKNGPRYKYVGATHEYIEAKPAAMRANFDGIIIRHIADGGAKTDKYQRDEKLLLEDIASGNNTARNYFYLGQTQMSLGKLAESVENYKVAYEKTEWLEEKYLACLTAGRVSLQADNQNAALEWFVRGTAVFPTRPECTYEIGKILAEIGAHQAAVDLMQPQISRMSKAGFISFLEDWIYDWGIEMQLAVSLWWTGKRVEAKKLFEELLTRPTLPEHMIERIKQNIAQC